MPAGQGTGGSLGTCARVAAALVVVVALAVASRADAAPPLQAKPLRAGPPAAAIVGTVGGKVVYMEGARGRHGSLTPVPNYWVTDGTERGTHPILKLAGAAPTGGRARAAAGYPAPARVDAVTSSGRLVFSANDGVHGWEWWSTDGTEAGTQMLLDAMPGEESSLETGDLPIALDNGAVIVPIADPEHGREWWRTDGTPEGTELIADVNPGPGSSHFGFLRADSLPAGNLLYFTAYTGQEVSELWRTDGTAAGTIPLGVKMSQGGLAGGDVDGELVFTNGSAGSAAELYASDGTPAGTHPYYDFPDAPLPGFPEYYFRAAEGRLFVSRHSALYAIDDAEQPPRHLANFWGPEPSAILMSGIPDHGKPNRAGFGFTAGSALIFDVYKGFPPIPTRWTSQGTPETTVPIDSLVGGPAPTSAVSTGSSRILLSQERRKRAALLVSSGAGRAKRVDMRREVSRLELSDAAGLDRATLVLGVSVGSKGERPTSGFWKVKRARR